MPLPLGRLDPAPARPVPMQKHAGPNEAVPRRPDVVVVRGTDGIQERVVVGVRRRHPGPGVAVPVQDQRGGSRTSERADGPGTAAGVSPWYPTAQPLSGELKPTPWRLVLMHGGVPAGFAPALESAAVDGVVSTAIRTAATALQDTRGRRERATIGHHRPIMGCCVIKADQ